MPHAANRPLSHSFPPDLSQHMLALPTSGPRFRPWFLIAVVAGILLGLFVLAVGNLIFCDFVDLPVALGWPVAGPSGEARLSIQLVDSLIDAFDALLSPLDERNVVRFADFFAHVAHPAQVGIRVHTELVAHLAVGHSSGKGPQYDSFFAGQSRVQPESRSAVDTYYFALGFHGFT